MTMTETNNQEVLLTKPILRLDKYYVKATNGACAKCERGNHGCCVSDLEITRDDFNIDFTNEEEVRALFNLGIFTLHANIDCYSTHASIRLKGRIHKRELVCVFWSDIGCILSDGAKPLVCRKHVCYRIEHDLVSNNLEDKERSMKVLNRRRYTQEEIQMLIKVGMDYDLKYKIHGRVFKKLDWDSILTVLQGHP